MPTNTEEKLPEDAGLHAKLLEALPVPVFYKDRIGRYLGFNKAYEVFFGATKDKLVGKTVFDINPPELAVVYNAKDTELFTKGGVQQYESQVKGVDGNTRDVVFNKAIFHDGNGSPAGIVGAILDVTENKKAEKTICEKEAELREIIENSPIATIVGQMVEGPEKALIINKKFTELFGYTIDDIFDIEHWWKLAYPDEKVREIARAKFNESVTQAAGNKTKILPVESSVVCKDGTVRYVRISLSSFDHKNIITFEDLTDRKQSDKEHQANLKFMESMDKINKAILGTDDLDEMMSNVLDVVLRVLDCDRAWLLTPSDPWVLSYRVPMERAKPGYPGALALGIEVPIDPETVLVLQKARATDGPVTFDPESDPPLPPSLKEHFGIQSQMLMDIYPKVEESWCFGVHQCSYQRVWTDEEKRLFNEIGRRITDALTSLLSYRNLKQSEEKYSRIITTAAEGILAIDKDHKFTFVNPRMLDMLGYTQKEILGHKFEEFILAEEMADHEHQMAERRSGNATAYDRRFRRKDGSIIWCNVSGTAILNDTGEYDGSFGMVTDVTERKKVEQTLKEQERFSQSLLRFSRDLEQAEAYGDALKAAQKEIKEIIGYSNVWAYRVDEKKEYAYSVAATGASADVVMSKEGTAKLKIEGDPMIEAIVNAKDIVVVADAQTDPSTNKEIVKMLGNRTLVNVPIILFDRNLGSIGMGTFGDEGVRVPTKSEQEYLIAMASHMAVAFDRIRLLDERKETVEILRKNADELKEAQRIGHFGNFDWNAETDTTFWSEEFSRIYGFDVTQKPQGFEEHLTVYTPESAAILRASVENILKTGEPYNVELEQIRPNGTRRWINIHGEAKRDKNNKVVGIRGTAQDITDAKEVEKMRVNFLMLASHQLRTPLSGTKWLIETLKKGLQGPINEKQKEYLDYLESINERMIRLVSDMLLAIRTESTDTTFQYVPISIPALFTDITAVAGAATIEKNIMIRDASSEHPIPQIVADPKFVGIILGSFISNAINYSLPNNEVIFDVKEEEGGVAFSVQDFGIGIPEDEQAHVLERFYRATNAKSLRPEGTGLGLYIADMLARKMGGSITHTSVVNEGSTFVLHLPKR